MSYKTIQNLTVLFSCPVWHNKTFKNTSCFVGLRTTISFRSYNGARPLISSDDTIFKASTASSVISGASRYNLSLKKKKYIYIYSIYTYTVCLPIRD